METPVAAFFSVCLFFLAIPLVTVFVTTVFDRVERIRSRPGFEVKLITGALPIGPLPTATLPVLPTKEDDHG